MADDFGHSFFARHGHGRQKALGVLGLNRQVQLVGFDVELMIESDVAPSWVAVVELSTGSARR